jgi:S-adenosylmethionine/arginine decarboxylase-like enzyme
MTTAPALQQHHWTFDGEVAEPMRATDLRKLLADLVRVIGMTPIASPAVYVDGDGWRGFQLIAESHISVDGRGRYCALDVFSCRPFDPEHVLACLAEWLHGRWSARWVERGLSVRPDVTMLEWPAA